MEVKNSDYEITILPIIDFDNDKIYHTNIVTFNILNTAKIYNSNYRKLDMYLLDFDIQKFKQFEIYSKYEDIGDIIVNGVINYNNNYYNCKIYKWDYILVYTDKNINLLQNTFSLILNKDKVKNDYQKVLYEYNHITNNIQFKYMLTESNEYKNFLNKIQTVNIVDFADVVFTIKIIFNNTDKISDLIHNKLKFSKNDSTYYLDGDNKNMVLSLYPEIKEIYDYTVEITNNTEIKLWLYKFDKFILYINVLDNYKSLELFKDFALSRVLVEQLILA